MVCGGPAIREASRGEASRVRTDYINIRSLGTSALKGAEVPKFWREIDRKTKHLCVKRGRDATILERVEKTVEL